MFRKPIQRDARFIIVGILNRRLGIEGEKIAIADLILGKRGEMKTIPNRLCAITILDDRSNRQIKLPP